MHSLTWKRIRRYHRLSAKEKAGFQWIWTSLPYCQSENLTSTSQSGKRATSFSVTLDGSESRAFEAGQKLIGTGSNQSGMDPKCIGMVRAGLSGFGQSYLDITHLYEIPARDFPISARALTAWWEERCSLHSRTQNIYVSSNLHEGRATLSPDDHRSRRPGARPDLRFRHHRLRGRAVGSALDHHRHLARGSGAGPRPHHGRPLSLVPAGRQPCWPAQGSRDQRSRLFPDQRRTTSHIPLPTTTSARASSTSASPTSRSGPSPTTPRST